MTYSNDLLEAIGAWQNGWAEDAPRRMTVTGRLISTIASASLPEAARRVEGVCYRKRFLVPHNPQNGGDFWRLILSGRIDEGVASWTTDLNLAKSFKGATREGNTSTIFAHAPRAEEVVLNIKALWEDPAFKMAAQKYVDEKRSYGSALANFKDLQSEVILDAPLLFDEVESFCDRASTLDRLHDIAMVTTEQQEEEFWQLMVKADTYPGDPHWLSREASRRALANIRAAFIERLRTLGVLAR